MHEQGQSGKTAPTPSQQSLFSRGVSLSGAGALCSLVFLSLETVLAVRVLDTATYGLCIFLLVITQILVVLSDLGCKTAITQLVASATAEKKAELVQSALVLRIAVVAGFSLLVWLVTPFFLQFESLHFMAPYANSLPLLYAVMSFEGFFGGALFGFQLYQHVVAAQILRGLLRFVFSTIFLLIFALDDFALIYSWLLSFGAAAIYQYCRLPISRRLVFSAARIRELLRFGLPLQGNSVLWTIYSQVDVLILGAYANPAAIGYLSVASKIPDIFQRLGQSYTSVYLPSASSLLAAGQHHETRQILESSLRLAAFCLSWATLGAFVFGEECLIFLFSDTYAFLGFAFGLLMLTYVMTFLTNLLGYTMTAAGRPELSLVENSVRAGLTIVGDLLLIPRYGLMGAVYAGIIAACVAHPLAVGLVRKCGISIRTGLYIKQLLILIVCISLCLVLDPVGFGKKLFLFSVLPVLSYVFATVSSADIGMLLPESLHQPLARFTQSTKMKIGLLNPGKPDGMISGRESS